MADNSQLSFVLPPIQDNPDGSWGPSALHMPPQFKDIPYAPFSKTDKLGKFADWTEAAEGRDRAGATGTQQRYGGRREGQPAYGSGSTNAFAYIHEQDEATFSVVDNKAAAPRRGGMGTFGRGRGGTRGTATRAGTTGRTPARGGAAQRTNARAPVRKGWKDWDKPSRTRESSVPINPTWRILEEIDFPRLSKLRLEVDDPETLDSYGKIYGYEKAYDRVNTKNERPLQIIDRIKYNTTTSDDPIIQQFANKNTATIYATDGILSLLMCAPRSVYPWDIVIIRDGNKLFFDKRDGGPFDFVTVNENAADPPPDNDKDNLNSAGSLHLEATYINENFAFQTVKESSAVNFAKPNPFYGPDETEPLASCGYRYRLFDLSIHEEEDVKALIRTQVDAFVPGSEAKIASGKDENAGLVTIKALNEFDSRAEGAGGAPDWRTKLDSQRGAVVATEMKNNSCKLAKWAVQSILAGAEVMKIGYVSRANPRDNTRHVILSTATMRPTDFASQLNINLTNGWGIVRTVADLCMKQPDGKYVLVKDPNRSVIRLYAVPMDTFTGEAEEPPIEEEAPEEEE
ncbi:Eukaryotic translation initiation factor 3 subunit D [Ceratobasidium theobromae]|uniref:Eukaryotic translation initiation factor 3 subunit D n=1 Tax=Ceratobasidium theobromae TaxID=1582974 RepID=A0A5N5QS80_9AGAM|nr:Eukaryotic translation initiation factor 3 subunit D [Ceratobasidium theobromae]